MLLDEVANADELTWADIRSAMEPDPELRLDVWSEQHVVIPKGSATSGPYRLSHTPYARRVLQCLSPVHKCSRVVVMAASQMLKTQTFVNSALGWIDLAPANILALEPTDKLAKRLSSRLAKAIDACGPVRQKVAKPRSRDARNTIDTKEFDGGGLYITKSDFGAHHLDLAVRSTWRICADPRSHGARCGRAGMGRPGGPQRSTCWIVHHTATWSGLRCPRLGDKRVTVGNLPLLCR